MAQASMAERPVALPPVRGASNAQHRRPITTLRGVTPHLPDLRRADVVLENRAPATLRVGRTAALQVHGV